QGGDAGTFGCTDAKDLTFWDVFENHVTEFNDVTTVEDGSSSWVAVDTKAIGATFIDYFELTFTNRADFRVHSTDAAVVDGKLTFGASTDEESLALEWVFSSLIGADEFDKSMGKPSAGRKRGLSR